MHIMVLARSKQAMISETGEHQRDQNRKLLYKAGPHLYPNPTPTRPIKKLEAVSTNVDTMSTTNHDEEWDMSIYNSREINKACSATFSHPDKITSKVNNPTHPHSQALIKMYW